MKKRSTCLRCKRPSSVCYCHTLQRVDNYWPVHILQHPRETKHAIGTAAIAALSLSHCQRQVGESFTLQSVTVEASQAVLVYPGEGAGTLDALDRGVPQALVFIDASWRKSHRMLMESPELQALPRVGLQLDQVSHYRIRKSKFEASLSTVEAIVHCLAFLEQDDKKYLPLLHTMDWMIEKQISLMGVEVFERNYLNKL